MVTIWHNPRCSKSRQTLSLLRDNGVEPQIVEYLKDEPSEADIRDALAKLGIAPRALMRTGEAVYKELGLKDVSDDDALIKAMVTHPILIERPVVLNGDKAALGRPPEDVLKIL